MKTQLLPGNKIYKNLPFAYYNRFIYLTFVLVCGVTVATWAQPSVLWDKTIGGNKSENLSFVQQTNDGGYILGGSSNSAISGDKTQINKEVDYWIVKLDANRNKLWDKTIGGPGSDHLTSMQQTSDGGYILGGYSYSGQGGDKSEENKGGIDELGRPTTDYWVVKINATGAIIWENTLGGNHNDHLLAVQQTSDGGYILGGWSFSGINADKSAASKNGDYWIVKLNANGTKVWDRTIGSNFYDEFATLQQTSDGGYIIGGHTEGTGGDKTSPTKGASDYWIVKLNADGTTSWDKTIGGSSYDRLEVVQQTQDGGYIVGGNSASGISGDKSEALRDVEEIPDLFPSDYWIVKLNATGTKEWDKTLGGTALDYLSSILQTSEGNYILGGYSFSEQGGEKTEPSKGMGDFWLVNVDVNGAKIWDKTIGGNYTDILTSLQPTPDGNYLLGGTSPSDLSGDKTAASQGATDYWLLKITDHTSKMLWNKRFGGVGAEYLTALIQTRDGGYLAGGYSNSDVGGDKTQLSWGKNDYWVVKTNAAGKKLWNRRFGGSNDDFLTTLIQTQDGGYLLGGSSVSGISGDKTQAGRGNRDYWIVKLDAQGNKQWDKRYGGTGKDELKKVIQLPSGRYILAGTSNSPTGGDKSAGNQGAQDYWILKISATGTRMWDRSFGGTLNDALSDLAFTADGGFLLGGSSASGVSGDKTQPSWGGYDYWLVRIDGLGNKLWDKRFGGIGDDNLTSLGSTNTSTGNFFIAGYSGSGVSGDKTQSSQGGTDFWMLKINRNGGKLWDKRFGGSQHERLHSIIITADGGYLLGGISNSDISGDKTQASFGNSDYWVVKTTSLGVKEWDKRFGGAEYDNLRTVLQTTDGGYILGGYSYSGSSGNKTQPSRGSTDFWLVALGPEPSGTSSPAVAREITLPEDLVILPEPGNLTVAPNPFRDRINVHFTLPQTQPVQVKVFDMQGREVTTLFQGEAQANKAYEVEWQAVNKAPGMYLLQLQTPTNRQQQKMILAK
ncbi:T9SS type A sorting domain-containing protein [Adhaeribacter swui]|uniref:T9SS type A sorting domain-containing protein n=1 Tax=Adhaeribacter swui TaxID=2086471 RepID=A0A7G7G4Q1_9BACT|nr:T9SS type A sorting domain-containing protein [Adhaeribacter swui]QNF32135.1 T9SS type A sorting domain-containing protein [Adhaeribacter swui]